MFGSFLPSALGWFGSHQSLLGCRSRHCHGINTLVAFVTMNHVQEEPDGSRKCAASTESQRTTGRCAPDDGCAVESSTREERSRASRSGSSLSYARKGSEGFGLEKEGCLDRKSTRLNSSH